MYKKILSSRKSATRWFRKGMALAAIGGSVWVSPALAEPLLGQSESSSSTNSAELTTLPIISPVSATASAQGGVLHRGIPSIKTPLEPIWEWSRQRIDKLTEQYRQSEVVNGEALSLTQAEEQALNNDHNLKASKYATLIQRYNVKTAEAGLYPTIGLNGNMGANGTLNNSDGGTYIDTSGSGSGSRVRVSSARGVRTNLSFGLSVSQTLYDYSLKRKIRRAELNEVATLADYEQKRLDTLLALRKAWFTAYEDQIDLYVLREAVNNKKMRLEQAKGLYEGGTKARIDVATAESDLAQAELQVIAQETQLGVDWINLNNAMGRSSHEPYRLTLDAYWDQGIDLTEEELVNIALAHHPELIATQAELRAQLCSLEIADASKYPALRASAGINESGNMTPLDGTWNVGLSLNWTLFNGYLSRYEKLTAAASARQIAERFEQQRLSIYSEVMSKAVIMRQAAAAVTAARAGWEKAQESYRLASARYQVGVGQSVEVSDAEVALAQAQMSYITAASKYRQTKAELLHAVGVDDLDNLPESSEPIQLDALPDEPGEEG